MGYPIAECFVAPQGEGTYTGRLMIFLRLSGCTVGTRYPATRYTHEMGVDIDVEHGGGSKQFPILPEYTNECHLYDGRTFACDTDYKKKMSLNTSELIALLKKTHATCDTICITGGEPMMHKQNFHSLVTDLKTANYKLHLETSGTIELDQTMRNTLLFFEHISVSPKLGFLDSYCKYAGDIKLLIDGQFNPKDLPVSLFRMFVERQEADEEVGVYADPTIWLQPVNYEHTINEDNLKRCLKFQMKYPHLRISMQAHKMWGTQ